MVSAPYRDDLNKIVVMNPKGGCGKTTLATNLASYFAMRGPAPTLVDLDRRGYSARWLERRRSDRPQVHGIADDKLATLCRRRWPFHVARNAGAIIVDTPAAIDQRDMRELTYEADCILVPILPSAFDVEVTTQIIARLLLLTDLDRPIGVVANRTRQKTRSLARLRRNLDELETPTIAVLRDSQAFVRAASSGLGIYEMPSYRVRQEIEQVDRIVDLLDQLLIRTLEPGLMSRLSSVRRMPPPRASDYSASMH